MCNPFKKALKKALKKGSTNGSGWLGGRGRGVGSPLELLFLAGAILAAFVKERNRETAPKHTENALENCLKRP